jgi:outer membrane protein OmpA-like peptidoglycan-associated protein
MKEGSGRLSLAFGLLLLLFGLSLWGLTVSTRRSAERQEARRQVTAALAERDPERAAALFRQARAFDAAYGFCEEGLRLEARGRFAEAAERFRACRDGDPGLVATQILWAEALFRAQGLSAGPELLVHLRSVQERARRDSSVTPEALQTLEDLVLELEELAEPEAPREHPEAWTVEELVDILTRSRSRGLSRYDGPRVPLRLGFRPGDVTLGRAAEAQLRDVVKALRDGRLARATIQIEGHTDRFEASTPAGREALARRRAEAVRDYLVRAGIPRERLHIKSLADEYPLASNGTLAGRDANRRVELYNLDEGSPIWGDVRKTQLPSH